MMAQTEERAIEDAKQEIASKTRCEAENMAVVITSVVHTEDREEDPLDTRVCINY